MPDAPTPEAFSQPPIPSLSGLLVDLLREAPLGLTPASLLEVIRERALFPEEGISERGLYQRVLRTLQQLETGQVVQRSGKRYLLDVAVADQRLEEQAKEILSRALQENTLTVDPQRLRALLDRAMDALSGEKGK